MDSKKENLIPITREEITKILQMTTEQATEFIGCDPHEVIYHRRRPTGAAKIRCVETGQWLKSCAAIGAFFLDDCPPDIYQLQWTSFPEQARVFSTPDASMIAAVLMNNLLLTLELIYV